jgi:hypothetical protein
VQQLAYKQKLMEIFSYANVQSPMPHGLCLPGKRAQIAYSRPRATWSLIQVNESETHNGKITGAGIIQ